MTTIRITPKNVHRLMGKYELGIGAPIYDLIVAIATMKALFKEPAIEIKVSCSLFGASYAGNPPMLTKILTTKIRSFSCVKVSKPMDKKHFVIVLDDEHRPATFRAAALAAIAETNIFRVERERVPASYRVQPSLFTRILSRLVAKPVACVTSETTHLTWRI